MRCGSILFLCLSFFGLFALADEPSICYGTTSNGRLDNGWKLPSGGPNFTSYSIIGRALGRTYVHSTVHGIVLDAYAALAKSQPDTIFVYGETGYEEGGEFSPHKTHRNGLSVDFMVPVRDANGESVPLPTHVLNKWGYSLEFDSSGRLDELEIDFEAVAEHIYQLREAALGHGADLWRVILDPELQPFLHDTARWPYLRENIQFTERRSWVRHDDHYHVDFDLACEPAA